MVRPLHHTVVIFLRHHACTLAKSIHYLNLDNFLILVHAMIHIFAYLEPYRGEGVIEIKVYLVATFQVLKVHLFRAGCEQVTLFSHILRHVIIKDILSIFLYILQLRRGGTAILVIQMVIHGIEQAIGLVAFPGSLYVRRAIWINRCTVKHLVLRIRLIKGFCITKAIDVKGISHFVANLRTREGIANRERSAACLRRLDETHAGMSRNGQLAQNEALR